ncbi:MAG: amino acid/amide transporter rane protein 2, family / amino acid/amide transporter [Frankiales bacterium]|nr:amino acid/amide transporter rane protein 2, family / amino acid/amide transporter [Frankiales bacterium]
MTVAEQTCLAARNLSAGYGSTVIVRDLNLTVRSGEIVALLGPNGSGRTTTLLTLCGELPSMGGEVEMHGRVTEAPLHERARGGMALVTEEKAILMNLTVAENLRVSRGDQDYALELFPDLKANLSRRAGLLSGGQQQMLSLARALSRRPSILLADELSLGLAPLVVDHLLLVIRQAANDGLGVLLVEQHVNKALNVADRVVVMRRGRVELEGEAAELRRNPDAFRAAYFATGADAGASRGAGPGPQRKGN